MQMPVGSAAAVPSQLRGSDDVMLACKAPIVFAKGLPDTDDSCCEPGQRSEVSSCANSRNKRQSV
jgi:hypothetical protein